MLMELRRLGLATDVSFRADLAAGFSFKQIALTASQAAQQYDAALKQNEEAMLSTAAFGGVAEARIAALRASPPRCDAVENARGMSENAFQAYVATYMASLINRAVSAVAACRARAQP